MNSRADLVRSAGQHFAEGLLLLMEAAAATQPAPRKSQSPSANDDPDDPLYLDTNELAERFRVGPSTLSGWRHQGTGPRWARFGTRVLYRLVDVDEWEQEQLAAGRREQESHSSGFVRDPTSRRQKL